MRFSRMLIALTAVGAIMFALAGPASAQPSPSDDCEPKEGWTLCVVPDEQKTTVTIGKVTVRASAISTGRVKFLLQGRAMTRAERRAARPGGCFMASGLNSGTANGVRWFFPYGRTLVCRDRTSPTGFRRAACSNPFIPSFAPKPKNIRIFRGRVILTRNIKAKIVVKSSSKVEAIGWVGDKICARATGSGFAMAVIRFRAFSRARGSRLVINRTSGNAFARAATEASAEVECVIITPPPPPPEKVKPKLIKFCFIDSAKVECPKNFGFSVNGAGGFTNSGGEETILNLEFNSGDSVTVCESNPQGWTRDGPQCQTKTAGSGYLAFTFVNKKVTPPPPPVTITVKAVTTHDVEGGNIVDLCATITRSDGSAVDPKDITFSPDEGSMISGTLHRAPSGNWCQGWQTVKTTINHDVRWTVFYQGKSDSNTMHVLADDW